MYSKNGAVLYSRTAKVQKNPQVKNFNNVNDWAATVKGAEGWAVSNLDDNKFLAISWGCRSSWPGYGVTGAGPSMWGP